MLEDTSVVTHGGLGEPGARSGSARSLGRRGSHGRDSSRGYWWFLAPAVVAVAVLIVVPLGFTGYYSLRNFNLQLGTDSFIGLRNYITALTGGDPDFTASLVRTFVYVAVVIGVDFIVGMTQALIIFRMSSRVARFWRAVFLLPILIIPTASAVFWQTIMYAPDTGAFLAVLGLGDVVRAPLGSPDLAFWAIIVTVIWAWSPWVFLLLSAGLDALDKDVIEAGMVDGATYFQRLRHIILPLMRPVIFITLAFKALDSFLSFPFVWVMTQGGPGGSTHLLSTYIYQKAFQFLDYGFGSALAIIMLVVGGGIAVVAVLIWQRFYGKEF